MKVFILEPKLYKSDLLFQTMGSCFEFVDSLEYCDWVFYDAYCGFGEYNHKDVAKAIELRKPVAVFEFHDYNDRITWPGFNNWTDKIGEDWADNIREFIGEGLLKVYFMRKMSKVLKYPDYIYPIECILYPDHIFTEITKEELYNRPNDLFFIGNISKERESVCNELSKHFKCDFVLGQERIPHEDWLNRARKSKMFLSASGGGYSDERIYQLITIAPLLNLMSNHYQYAPFTHYINCIQVDEKPYNFQIAELKNIISNPDLLYHIYKRGIEHAKNYYSAEARSKYILSILKK